MGYYGTRMFSISVYVFIGLGGGRFFGFLKYISGVIVEDVMEVT